MRGSNAEDIRIINERYERREVTKKLLIEVERVSVCLANAERLAGRVFKVENVNAINSLAEVRRNLTDVRLEIDAVLGGVE